MSQTLGTPSHHEQPRLSPGYVERVDFMLPSTPNPEETAGYMLGRLQKWQGVDILRQAGVIFTPMSGEEARAQGIVDEKPNVTSVILSFSPNPFGTSTTPESEDEPRYDYRLVQRLIDWALSGEDIKHSPNVLNYQGMQEIVTPATVRYYQSNWPFDFKQERGL